MTVTPSPTLGRMAFPVLSVPMRLRLTTIPEAPLLISTPFFPLPEITLPDPAMLPPMLSFCAPPVPTEGSFSAVRSTPSTPLSRATRPVMSVPI